MTMEKLKNLRKQRGYTQQQIADIIATDVSNYSEMLKYMMRSGKK